MSSSRVGISSQWQIREPKRREEALAHQTKLSCIPAAGRGQISKTKVCLQNCG